MKEDTPGRGSKRERLRWGFSTGTAAVAAALAAFRHLVAGQSPGAVAVRLPSGIYLPVPIHECLVENGCGLATVIKDGGDDPDVTHKAKIRARVRVLKAGGPVPPSGSCSHPHLADGTNSGAIQSCPKGGFSGQAIKLIAGEGVGIATKAGLPIAPGEPAINPVPRGMFSENLSRELLLTSPEKIREKMVDMIPHEGHASVLLPLGGILDELVPGIILEVEIQVPGGEALARHTLNPRLGVVGGISILGTTGIVKPFSNEAYEETIRSALAVAASNGCSGVVLSTGGKSERFAKSILPDEPVEAFVQVADFFSFSVREARRFGFRRIVHSVFFGKAVKMAQG
ncbi:MAG: cobalt-precorrin-5B (C(1))-methyltransferase CbiD, partial [Syntrophobacteraceae bacterium]